MRTFARGKNETAAGLQAIAAAILEVAAAMREYSAAVAPGITAAVQLAKYKPSRNPFGPLPPKKGADASEKETGGQMGR
jgi:hypothetical protein